MKLKIIIPRAVRALPPPDGGGGFAVGKDEGREKVKLR